MRILFLFIVLFSFSACQGVTSTTAEASIDGLALAALTSEKAALQRPCTTSVTTLCINKATTEKVEEARTVLWDALQAYWAAADAYRAAVKDNADVSETEASLKAAYAALKSAISNANDILSLAEVKAVLAEIAS